jgi:hypothetical protein
VRKSTTAGSSFLGTYVPVAVQGSAWPRLRQALDHGNLVEALSAASKLEHVGLAEALELLLLIRDQDRRSSSGRRCDGTLATAVRFAAWAPSRRRLFSLFSH